MGTYQGNRFEAEYICSDVCPNYTVLVYHFIDMAVSSLRCNTSS